MVEEGRLEKMGSGKTTYGGGRISTSIWPIPIMEFRVLFSFQTWDTNVIKYKIVLGDKIWVMK